MLDRLRRLLVSESRSAAARSYPRRRAALDSPPLAAMTNVPTPADPEHRRSGPLCQTCRHPQRAAIELALARRVSTVTLGRKYGLSKSSLYRHRQIHMSARLIASLQSAIPASDVDLDKLREDESQSLLWHLVAQRARLYVLVDLAEADNNFNGACQAHARLTQNLRLTGKLLGEFSSHATTITNNLTISPKYLKLRQNLLLALRDHPGARVEVARVLRALEAPDDGPQLIEHDT